MDGQSGRFLLMKRVWLSLLVVVVGAVGVWLASVASADHNGSRHENMTLIANYSDAGTYRNGTDIAFWGNTALLGRLDQSSPAGPGGFRVMNISDPANPREIGEFTCPGDQSDVSIWGNLVVTSVDKPTEPNCAPTTSTSTWEGIRLVSLANPANPTLLKEIRTDCGSHTNTIYPDPANNKLYVYVLSYPLAGRYNPAQSLPTCNAAGHHKISVVEVDLANPAATGQEDVHTVEVGAGGAAPSPIGCHDVTLFLQRKLAAAACLTESQMWDLSNPAQPKVISRIHDPLVNIHHSTVFSNDGKTMVIGDELGGAAASPGCLSDEDTYGGLFFYDVSGEKANDPKRVGTYKLPQQVVSEFCTAHLFNVIPRRDEKDTLVSSWYAGATSVIDFTDPSNPTQVAYYIPSETTSPDQQPTEAAAWSSYWYNGFVYSNNFDEDVNSISKRSRGLDVFRIDLRSVTRGALKLPRLNPQVQEPITRSRD
jgi:hypothetical protein